MVLDIVRNSETLDVSFPNINSIIPARGNHYPEFCGNSFLAFSLELTGKKALLDRLVLSIFCLLDTFVITVIFLDSSTLLCMLYSLYNIQLFVHFYYFWVVSSFLLVQKVMFILVHLVHGLCYACEQVSVGYIAKNEIAGLKNILNFIE